MPWSAALAHAAALAQLDAGRCGALSAPSWFLPLACPPWPRHCGEGDFHGGAGVVVLVRAAVAGTCLGAAAAASGAFAAAGAFAGARETAAADAGAAAAAATPAAAEILAGHAFVLCASQVLPA